VLLVIGDEQSRSRRMARPWGIAGQRAGAIKFVVAEEVEVYRYAVANLQGEGGAAGKIETDEWASDPNSLDLWENVLAVASLGC
jgi:hypothetical protein